MSLDHPAGARADARRHLCPRGELRELALPEVDHEARVLRVVDRPDPGRERPSPGRPGRIVPIPVQLVCQIERLAGPDAVLRLPEGDDVVVRLDVRGHLDQHHAAGAPLADGLDPGARPLLVVRLEILIEGEVPLALEQPEAARIAVLEGAQLEPHGVAQRPPDPLAAAGVHQQAVRVVHAGTEVAEIGLAVLRVPEHAGERREPEPARARAREQGGLHVRRPCPCPARPRSGRPRRGSGRRAARRPPAAWRAARARRSRIP